MELCVLDRDGELSGERRQERYLVLARHGPCRGIGGEQAYDLASRHEGSGERRADAGLAGRRLGGGEPRVAHDVRNLEHRSLARRAECNVEQSIRDTRMRARQAATHRGLELAVADAAEVDRHASHAEELGDPFDRRLESVGDR